MITFTDVTLAEAAAELNRYSEIKISVDAQVADERLSGVFRVGDQVAFAAALEGLMAIEAEHSVREIHVRRRGAQ